jgi:hypothetical protein
MPHFNHPPPLFNPATLEENRARYPRALLHVFDYTDDFPDVWPCCRPQQWFDFEDGLRLVVTVDKEERGMKFLHLSASAQKGTDLFMEIAGGEVDEAELKRRVEQRFSLLPTTMRRTPGHPPCSASPTTQ